jgi:2-polyprenyl-3-methyl-5-hydroxy-6-metoxy-1,4-benzoquinol methylase
MLIKMVSLSDEEKNLEMMSSAANYNRWLFRNLKRFIGKRVLEIGGGIGNMTQFMISRQLVVSTDVTDYNISKLKSRFKNKKNFFAVKTDISKTLEINSLKKFSFDTVVCINVLEHIKNDLDALKNMRSLLDRKGRLVLLVPAFSALYGTIDRADHHYRRYDKKTAIKKIKKAGFRIIKVYYMNVPGFFGWLYHGRILKKRVHLEGDLSLFDRLVPFFSFCETLFRPPFGLSLIIIAEK